MAEEGGNFDDEGKKHFELLNQMFAEDPDIEEYDFIFCPDCIKIQENDQIAIVNVEHKLGIKSWSVKSLMMYVYNRLIHQRKKANIEVIETLQLSRALLLLNAECSTAWNIRKELVMAGVLGVDDDLKFSSLILSKLPRSAETFCHRKWLINHYIKQKGKCAFAQEWLKKELSICLYCADHYNDNYIAWTHRGMIMEEFIDSKKKLIGELYNMEKWVYSHISDHCCYHYRQKVLEKLKNISSQNDMAVLLLEEYVFVTKLQESFPGHESVWYHRRFVFEHLNQWIHSLPTKNLQEIGDQFPVPKQFSSSPGQQGWMSSVMSLSALCQTALGKLRSAYEEDIQASNLSAGFPNFQSELSYCESISRKYKDSERLASRYRKWLQMRFEMKT